MELVSTTKTREVSITIEPLNDKVMGMKIRENGITVASLDLALVWDFVVDSLRKIAHPQQFLGLSRRCYIARNTGRLTSEWLDIEKGETNDS